MEFLALGSLEVRRDGVPIDLGPRKLQTLLARLLIDRNTVVSTDRIVDALWGPDATDREKALWVHVSRLRTALEPDRTDRTSTVLKREAGGYRLVVGAGACDLDRFPQLAADGRALLADDPVRAADRLTRALALWRGPALEGFRYDDFAQAEIARVEELHVTTQEDRVDADLARGLAGELVSELEVLRREHPLRERPIGQLMLALYRSGRAADALRAFIRFRDQLDAELGIVPSPPLRRLEEQMLLHDERLRRRPLAGERAVVEHAGPANPFKGLRAFTEDDAGDFFGRGALVADVLRRLAGRAQLVAVVGASGSGKSSLVRAGVVPAVRKEQAAGTGWQIAAMVPGAHPFAELEAALLRSTAAAPPGPELLTPDDDVAVLRAVLRVLPDDGTRMLLIVDQFEELHTLVDRDTRTRFLANLLEAIDDPRGRIAVVLTLRADFYGDALQHPAFGARLDDAVVNVTALSTEELEAAASEPARRVGVAIEPALMGELLSDIGSEPGGLPLFQYALTELFDRRVGDLLMLSTYRSMGGVRGAVGRRAADLYAQLTPEARTAARQLFLRLVAVTGREPARRRVPAAELLALEVDPVTVQEVVGRFGTHRLLSFDADRLTGEPTVELAHEALLSAWDDLRDWITASRDDLRRHAALAVAQREWQLSRSHPDYLLTGNRLADHERWADATTIQLTTTERHFLAASAARRDEEARREAERVQHEAHLRRQARRRLMGLVVAVVALGVLAAGVIAAALAARRPTVAYIGTPDDAFEANIMAGLDRAARELDIELHQVTPVVDFARDFEQLLRTEPDLVIVSNGTALLNRDVIDAHPGTTFGVIESGSDIPGSASVTFAAEQGAFLAGAAAAMRSETGVVGYVGGLRMPSVEPFRAGFEAGARHVDPDVEVLATYIEEPFEGAVGFFLAPFGRPDLGRERAEALFERADVVFHAASASGFGVFDAAVAESQERDRQLWAIGVDNDQWLQADADQRRHLLTSMIKRADLAAFLLVRKFVDGTFEPGVTHLDLADDAMDYAVHGTGLTTAMVDRLEQLKRDVAVGRIRVPAVPSGELLVYDRLPDDFATAFADLDEEDILRYFDHWLLPTYGDETVAACNEGTMRACGRHMTDHLDEWRAAGGGPDTAPAVPEAEGAG